MPAPRVSLVTLGCARNDTDSADLERRLLAAGWEVVADGDDPGDARGPDVVLVNTCGFIEQAKRDSLEVVLDAADSGAPVVVSGCLAERYGAELARELPEAAAVLGFDDYPDIADRLARVLAGETPAIHEPRDRRRLLPTAPAERPGHAASATAGEPMLQVARIVREPIVPVKLATGCDRRCTFCAIPMFRGSFVSRPLPDLLEEIRAVVAAGAAEVCLVSENTTSYGKDLGDLRLLERSLASIADAAAPARVRLTYLQPAEMRPGLLHAIATTAGIAPYFDLSLQHASGPVLRRMRRFGDGTAFEGLIDGIRGVAPEAGIRSNVIVGFPGETDDDVDALADFLDRTELDAIGVFGFSPEEGTEAATMPDQVDPVVIADRVRRIRDLADEVMLRRATRRIGEHVEVVVESVAETGTGTEGESPADVVVEGRAAHQGPEDASTLIVGAAMARPGAIVRARVVGVEGVDLVADAR